jgi:hypothetical protein
VAVKNDDGGIKGAVIKNRPGLSAAIRSSL